MTTLLYWKLVWTCKPSKPSPHQVAFGQGFFFSFHSNRKKAGGLGWFCFAQIYLLPVVPMNSLPVCSIYASVRACWMPLNWSYRWCEPPWGCWDSNPSPLQEHQMLLTSEPSPQLYRTCESGEGIQVSGLASIGLDMLLKLAWNSRQSSCFSIPSADLKGIPH